MRNAIILILILLLIGISAYGTSVIFQNQKKNAQAVSTINPNKPDDLEIIQPKLDPANGKQLLVNPETGGVLQVKTNQGVVITLSILPGALKKATVVKLVPFREDGNPSTLDTGVLITPGTLSFFLPASLSFNIKNTSLKNDAPVQADPASRITGSSHVYRLIPKKKSIIPVLVARSGENNIYTPSWVISGGAYTLSLTSTRAEALSRVVLADKSSRPLPIMEAASYLVGNHKSLSIKEKAVVVAAQTFMEARTLPDITSMNFIPSADETLVTTATSSASEISSIIDGLNADGYIQTPVKEIDKSDYDKVLESLQEPKPSI